MPALLKGRSKQLDDNAAKEKRINYESVEIFNAAWIAVFDKVHEFGHSKRLAKSMAEAAGNEAVKLFRKDVS